MQFTEINSRTLGKQQTFYREGRTSAVFGHLNMSFFFKKRQKLQQVILVLIVSFFGTISVADESSPPVSVEIMGVKSSLEKQLKGFLSVPKSASPSAMRHWQRTAQQHLSQTLAAMGYNNHTIDSIIDGTKLTILIQLGPATTYSQFNVGIDGAGNSEPLLNEFIETAAPRIGQQLDHASYESFKNDLLSIALTLGYFDATYSKHRLAVSREMHKAQVDLVLDSGRRFTFGPVSFEQSELSPTFLQQWIPFQQGDGYNADDVDRMSRDLRNSGYFSSVRARPEIDNSKDGAVPITVESSLREPHSATVGIGYGTDSGVRLRGAITRHYVNKYGHSAGIESELSQENQELSAYYRVPHFPDPANHYLQFDSGVSNTIIDDTDSLRYSLGLKHHRITSALWSQLYSLTFQHETAEINTQQTRTRLLIPGVSWSREKTYSLSNWGSVNFGVDAQLSFARKALLSDLDFDRFYIKLGAGQAFSAKHLLHSRLELGWVESSEFSKIPPSLRFYAGGDDSIRGYGRRKVSPTDAEGNAIGGRYLTTLSLEYEYRIRESLGLAFFVDSGRAGYNEFDPIAYGAGFGLRWYSPVGPIKTYIGFPLKGDDKSAMFHLSMGR